MSMRSLKRKLDVWGLKRKRTASDGNVRAAIELEITRHGNHKGYRQMTSALRLTHGLQCSRKQAATLLKEIDPVASTRRRARRLVRREYYSAGPCDLWHMDGYDKLKPYGIAIHGCIDGFSRKVMWLKACYSNNDPKLLEDFTLNFLEEMQCAPRLLRTDCGTENGIAAAIQSYIHSSSSSHIYGKSTTNQRIESFWSKLKSSVQDWIDFFKDLTDQGIFHPGHTMQTYAFRYVFLDMINNSLQQFLVYWNTHHIRQSSQLPGGIPDVLFSTYPTLGIQPDINSTVDARCICIMPELCPKSGDQEVDEYFDYIVEELHLNKPETKSAGVAVFERIMAAAE